MRTRLAIIALALSCASCGPDEPATCGPEAPAYESLDGCNSCSECNGGWLCSLLFCYRELKADGHCVRQPCVRDDSEAPGLQPSCDVWTENEGEGITLVSPCEFDEQGQPLESAEGACFYYATGDELSAACAAEGYVLEVQLLTSIAEAEAREYNIYCQAPDFNAWWDGEVECLGPGPAALN